MKQKVTLFKRVLLSLMALTTIGVGEANAQSMKETPLTLEAVEAGTINIVNPNALTIEYNKNGGGWTSAKSNPISITVTANDVLQLRGDNPTYCTTTDGEKPTQITATNNIYVYGNVMSLISSTGFATLTTLPKVGGDQQYDSDNTFAYLFTTSGEYLDPVPNTTIHNHPTKDIVLPALNVTRCGYMYMFARCKNLTRAPELPATELGWGCYHQMFCSTAIERAPVLPAATVPHEGYSSMFDQCANLNYVKCLATDISVDGCTYGWLTGVAPTGTLVKADGMDDWTVGPKDEWGRIDGIPTGWTVVNASEETTSMKETPLTFEAVEAGTIKVYLDEKAVLERIQYQLNGGEWTTATWGDAISLSANDKICFRGNNGTCYDPENEHWAGFHFESSNDCYVYGNIMSLIDQTNFATNTTLTKSYAFFHLFQNSDYSDNTTFKNHPSKDIVLPATTLTINCYDGLFANCKGITRAPVLPATTLADWCYCMMFSGTSITTAPELPATTLANACYSDMFMNCTSLTTTPELPAPTLVEGCYSSMFSGCTSLNYVKCLATNISANYCTTSWLDGVAAAGTFVKAEGMEAWPVGPQGEPSTVNGIPSGWTVNTESTCTLNGNSDGEGSYWATYYNNSISYTADANTTVYTAKISSDKTKVELTEVTDKVIPAGNAVILKSTGKDITMTYNASATGTLTGNDLKGSATAITTPENTYMLTKGSKGVGFYHWTGTNVQASRGYLTISGAAARSFLPIGEGETTAINGITDDTEADAPLYDLTGRKVAGQPRQGIYVKNGKKIIIK